MGKLNSKTIKLSLLALLVAVVLGGVLAIWVVPGKAHKTVYTNWFGVAIKGYDSVAYHTEARAVKGDSEFSYVWNDAKWYFASAKNRELFAANPERYAPQYGGY
jgi:YHS domain-containing protein